MNIVEVLRNDYGCEDQTTDDIVQWVETLPEIERRIFERRLIGHSLREIGVSVGISHTSVSTTIKTWGRLHEILDGGAERIW